MPDRVMFLSIVKHLRASRVWKVLLLFSFLIITVRLISQDYNFRNFNSGEGLAQSYVYTILQDAKGYLWIGTGNGLARYSGLEFVNFTTRDSLADNFITCGIPDGGYLWFGHMNGRMSLYNGKEFHAVDVPNSTMSPVTHFAKGPDNQVWASTYADGLVKLNREKGVLQQYVLKDQALIVTFEFCSETEILLGTTAGLFFCRLKEPGGIEVIRLISEIPESKIAGIQRMRNGKGFYIATENDGIFRLLADARQFKIVRIEAEREDDFTGIQGILEDSRSDLWAVTFGEGLIKLNFSDAGDQMKIICLNRSNGYVSDNVKTVFEDREGNLWSGNYGEGLTQITSKAFSVVTFDRTLYGNSVFSLYSDLYYIWIGTEKGLMKMDPLTGKILKLYNKGSGLPKDTVTAIYSGNRTELWLGTEKSGLYLMDLKHERIRKYPLGSGALENSITCITGRNEQVWIGTKKGLCHLNMANGRINWYTISQGGLPHNLVNGLFMDKTGRLWVSTRSNILSYIQDEKVNRIPVNIVSGILVLGPITEDKDSHIWAGSNGNGVFLMGTDTIRNITTKEGLLSSFCYSIICDSSDAIWVAHKDGLSRIRTSDFSVKPIQHIENKSDTFQFNPGAILRDPREIIWFGSDKGLISFDPSREYSRNLPPVLGITSIKINDEEWDIRDNILLPPGNYTIKIDFLGISLKDPTLVTYQYKLDGYDHWSEITKSNSVTYKHLTEGEYTFTLNASSGDGVVTEQPLTISINIRKPFWKNGWFYIITSFSLLLLIILYIKRREYRFRLEKQILEEKVRERTNEIQRQKDEIELQRDLIDKKNADITSSILYARQIQNAILPPQELLDKLLPDSFIMNIPKDIVSGDFYWLAEKNGKIVFTVADCTGHGVPGAFMSLLGITLLNEIVNVEGIVRSDAIITNLRQRVVQSLQQSRKDIITSDGIDIALCILEKDRKVIQYSGGMNELVYVRKGELEVVKADHLSVSVVYEDASSFTMKEISYQKGDVFYLFSDGYQDQFGGEHNKKYLSHRFYKTLLEISALPMSRQKEILEQKLREWMKDNIQTDDITVMGIRF
jgi:ligand-binding sensor domain-containing protein/serine phosphatase RsbU (regulator of sigma subunit)